MLERRAQNAYRIFSGNNAWSPYQQKTTTEIFPDYTHRFWPENAF